MEQILEKIENELEKELVQLEMELADIEYVKEGGYNYLRVYAEKKDGNTSLDDCVEVSQKIDELADKLINEKFYLEVSTPGLERKLKKEKDFVRFVGNKIKLYSKIQIENKKTFEGKLEKFENNTIFINDINLNKMVEVPLDKLKKANIIYDISAINSKEE